MMELSGSRKRCGQEGVGGVSSGRSLELMTQRLGQRTTHSNSLHFNFKVMVGHGGFTWAGSHFKGSHTS